VPSGSAAIRRLIDLGWPGAKIRPEDVVLIGVRDLDGEEAKLMRKAGVTVYTMKEVDHVGLPRIAEETLARLGKLPRLHVSFDADVLDPEVAPGVGTPVPGGFTYREAHLLMELFADSGHVTSLDLDATYPSLNVYGVDFSTAMQKVQTDLKAVGINLQLNPVEISVWADKIGTDGIPVTMLYFAPDHTDSSQYVQYFGLLEGSQWQTWGGTDVSTEQTDLLTQPFAEPDATKRAAIYKQLAESMMADNVIIPVVNPNLFLAARDDIKGLYYSACCNLIPAQLSRR